MRMKMTMSMIHFTNDTRQARRVHGQLAKPITAIYYLNKIVKWSRLSRG